MLTKPRFEFRVTKLPAVNWFVQSVKLPGINLPAINVPNPFIRMPVPGDHVTYGSFGIHFKIDENMENYFTVFNWITGLGFPDDFGEYAEIARQPQTTNGIYSDATLTICDAQNNPKVNIFMKDMFPTSLSDLPMDSTDTEINYIPADAEFTFLNYSIERITA